MLACSGLVEEVIRSIVTTSKLNVKCGPHVAVSGYPYKYLAMLEDIPIKEQLLHV